MLMVRLHLIRVDVPSVLEEAAVLCNHQWRFNLVPSQ